MADISPEIKKMISQDLENNKLSPLEFTILENIFAKRISGYDLIEKLNKHFAGTWIAKDTTIYPLLSKLKRRGFLDTEGVKSPLGPIIKLYFLTEAGAEIIKTKVNKNFLDQLKFIENFLLELTAIYMQSIPDQDKEEKTVKIQNVIRTSLESIPNIINSTQSGILIEKNCPKCHIKIDREDSSYCSSCGALIRGTR